MKVQIRAVAPQGVEVNELPFGGRRIPGKGPNGEDVITHVSGRFFPTGTHREIEVLDQDDEPAHVKRSFPNPSMPGSKIEFLAEDPDRMGRKTYQAMVESGHFTIQETASVDARITGAEVAAAKAENARLASDLMNANIALGASKTRIGALEAEVEALKLAAVPSVTPGKKPTKESRHAT
jgi:hypothetical protein